MKEVNKLKYTAVAIAVCLGLPHATTVYAQNEDLDSLNIERIEVRHQRQAYRGDVPLKETPQAVSIVNGDLLQDAGIVSFQNALDLASGIERQNSFGGMWDSFAIRGFAGDENLPSGYLVNGFSAGRGFSGRRNTANIESIEILKGPGSALYGRSEPGGTVNIITKKPQFFEEGYLQISAGNHGTRQAEADYTNALTHDLAFRINGAYENSDSFRDDVEINSATFNPSLLWNISDNTNLTYELEFLDQETTFDRGIVVLDNTSASIPVNRFYGEPEDGPIAIQATGHQLVIQHNINDGWDMLAGIGLRDSSFKGFSSDAELSGSRQLVYSDAETLVRQRRHRDFDASDISARLELSGKVQTGALIHHLLIGIDGYDYQLESLQSRWRVAGGSGDSTYATNLLEPIYGQDRPEVSPFVDQLEEQESLGAYIQNQIDLNDQWKILLGIRFDKFEQTITNNFNGNIAQQNQNSTSPRAGLVYNANENITLYTSYAEGFRPNSGAGANGETFEPEESKSYEMGMKWSTDNDVFNGSLALFKAQKSNILTADPVNTGFSAALGEAQSQGIELDIHSQIGENTTLSLAYAYTDAETVNDVVNADWGVAIPSGSKLINIAENTANITLQHFMVINDYEANIGASINYVGDRLGETIDPEYVLPWYTVTRLFGSIDLSENYELKFDIENLFDEEYYSSSYHKLWTMPGASRTYRVSVKYKF
ncbi:TonB-dependent siderophore receptor [Shewanella sp. A14]